MILPKLQYNIELKRERERGGSTLLFILSQTKANLKLKYGFKVKDKNYEN